jgi:hypothetical protein
MKPERMAESHNWGYLSFVDAIVVSLRVCGFSKLKSHVTRVIVHPSLAPKQARSRKNNQQQPHLLLSLSSFLHSPTSPKDNSLLEDIAQLLFLQDVFR